MCFGWVRTLCPQSELNSNSVGIEIPMKSTINLQHSILLGLRFPRGMQRESISAATLIPRPYLKLWRVQHFNEIPSFWRDRERNSDLKAHPYLFNHVKTHSDSSILFLRLLYFSYIFTPVQPRNPNSPLSLFSSSWTQKIWPLTDPMHFP